MVRIHQYSFLYFINPILTILILNLMIIFMNFKIFYSVSKNQKRHVSVLFIYWTKENPDQISSMFSGYFICPTLHMHYIKYVTYILVMYTICYITYAFEINEKACHTGLRKKVNILSIFFFFSK